MRIIFRSGSPLHTSLRSLATGLTRVMAFLCLLVGLTPSLACAQFNGLSQSSIRSSRPFSSPSKTTITQYGFGVLVGRISGITLKMRRIEFDAPIEAFINSIDVNLTTNFDDDVLWSAHFLQENRIIESPLVFYLGPGLTAGVLKTSAFWGLSGVFGAYFSKGPYEVFLQGMPRLYLMPNMNGRMEAATGLRVFF